MEESLLSAIKRDHYVWCVPIYSISRCADLRQSYANKVKNWLLSLLDCYCDQFPMWIPVSEVILFAKRFSNIIGENSNVMHIGLRKIWKIWLKITVTNKQKKKNVKHQIGVNISIDLKSEISASISFHSFANIYICVSENDEWWWWKTSFYLFLKSATNEEKQRSFPPISILIYMYLDTKCTFWDIRRKFKWSLNPWY